VPFAGATKFYYKTRFSHPISKEPVFLYLGYVKGPYRIFLDGKVASSGHANYNQVSLNLDRIPQTMEQVELIVEVGASTNLNAGIVHNSDIGLTSEDGVRDIVQRGLRFITLQGALIFLTRTLLLLMAVLFFIHNSRRSELVLLAATVLLSSITPLKSALILLYDLPSYFVNNIYFLAIISSKVLMALFVLAFFRVKLSIILSLGLLITVGHIPFLWKLGTSSDPQNLLSTFSLWSRLPYAILTVLELAFALTGACFVRSHFNIPLRNKLSTVLVLSLLVSPSVEILSHIEAISGPTGSIQLRELTNLAQLILIAFVPFAEMVYSDKQKEVLELQVQALVEKILSTTARDFGSYVQWVLDEARLFFGARRGSIALRDGPKLSFAFVSGETPPEIVGTAVNEHSVAQTIADAAEAMAIPNAKHHLSLNNKVRRKGYSNLSFLSAPLAFQGETYGMIFISEPENHRGWFNHLESPQIKIFANKIASEIYKEKQAEELRAKNRELEQTIAEADRSLRVLSTTVDDHFHEEDEDTSGHNGAVVTFSEGILRAVLELGLKDKIEIGTFEKDIELNSLSFRQRLKRIAMMHDIGKREVPAAILCKKDRLIYPDETQAMQGHALASYYILQGRKFEVRFNRAIELEKVQRERFGKTEHCRINYLDTEGKRRLQRLEPNYEKLTTQYPDEYDGIVAASHQEHWNGEGYPFALQGPQIPVIGRIMCLADSMAVMKLREVYEPPKSWEWVFFELERCAGTQFDPILVRAAQHYWLSRMPTAAKLNVQLAVQKGLAGKAAQDSGIFEKHSRNSRSAA
jgi:HD-GYP domain-containing protein (c-di-GMP phosphodiesterase class II)